MKNELNEKIAKWCEFTEIIPKEWFQPGHKYLRWVYPNKLRMARLPQFTSSMDAIIKWVVPNYDGDDIEILKSAKSQWLCVLMNFDIDNWLNCQAKHESMPMAFCLALEKYIDNITKSAT